MEKRLNYLFLASYAQEMVVGNVLHVIVTKNISNIQIWIRSSAVYTLFSTVMFENCLSLSVSRSIQHLTWILVVFTKLCYDKTAFNIPFEILMFSPCLYHCDIVRCKITCTHENPIHILNAQENRYTNILIIYTPILRFRSNPRWIIAIIIKKCARNVVWWS